MGQVFIEKTEKTPLIVESTFDSSKHLVNFKKIPAKRVSASEKKNGVVYTPERLAKYVSDKLAEYFLLNNSICKIINPISILDPACGDGELLSACLSSLSSRGISSKNVSLNGVDIDPEATAAATHRLQSRSPTKIINTNGLCPFNTPNEMGWKTLREQLGSKEGFDLIIANPPWGADIREYMSLLKASNLELFERQHDSSDLFVESIIRQLKPLGFAAFIIPDSIFSQERANLRKVLATKTTIKFIGRFGEKIFPSVNRACAVIIVQNTPPDVSSNVDCFRLNAADRNLIIFNKSTFHDIDKKVSHKVRHSRFSVEPEYLFNIDLENEMEFVFNKISSQKKNIHCFLSSTRGVELSKKGSVIKCPKCEIWQPLPKKELCFCSQCREYFNVKNGFADTIITNTFNTGLKSLIVGKDIKRYTSSSNLWIDTTRSGINYKSKNTYTGDKLIIRKTGVGITAAIDYTGSLTNQVVYIFKKINDHNDKLPLELFLMILSSRLAFFYIVMIGGENEWKTHPYLTQKRILNIPVPCLEKANEDTIKKAIFISKKIKKITTSGGEITRDIDAVCEKIVADLYGLCESDYLLIFKVIEESQELIPVKALRKISIPDIFGN